MKRGAPLQRKTPLKRSGFKRPERERQRAALVGMTRCHVRYGSNETFAPQEKEQPVRSEAYRRLVAAMPCWLCKCVGHSQAAHADQNKGGAIKSNDLTCYPLCAAHGNLPGCHWIIGTSGTFTKAVRRALEQRAMVETQAVLIVQARSDMRTARVLRQVGLISRAANCIPTLDDEA